MKHHAREDAPRKVAALVAEFGRESRTVWGSMDEATSRRCYAADPSIALFCSPRRIVMCIIAYWVGLLPFLPLKEGAWEVPYPTTQLTAAARRRLQRYFGDGAVSRRIADLLLAAPLYEGLVKHLQARGIQVVVWVVNDGENIAECGRRRYNGVMTDRPHALKKLFVRYMRMEMF